MFSGSVVLDSLADVVSYLSQVQQERGLKDSAVPKMPVSANVPSKQEGDRINALTYALLHRYHVLDAPDHLARALQFPEPLRTHVMRLLNERDYPTRLQIREAITRVQEAFRRAENTEEKAAYSAAEATLKSRRKEIEASEIAWIRDLQDPARADIALKKIASLPKNEALTHIVALRDFVLPPPPTGISDSAWRRAFDRVQGHLALAVTNGGGTVDPPTLGAEPLWDLYRRKGGPPVSSGWPEDRSALQKLAFSWILSPHAYAGIGAELKKGVSLGDQWSAYRAHDNEKFERLRNENHAKMKARAGELKAFIDGPFREAVPEGIPRDAWNRWVRVLLSAADQYVEDHWGHRPHEPWYSSYQDHVKNLYGIEPYRRSHFDKSLDEVSGTDLVEEVRARLAWLWLEKMKGHGGKIITGKAVAAKEMTGIWQKEESILLAKLAEVTKSGPAKSLQELSKLSRLELDRAIPKLTPTEVDSLRQHLLRLDHSQTKDREWLARSEDLKRFLDLHHPVTGDDSTPPKDALDRAGAMATLIAAGIPVTILDNGTLHRAKHLAVSGQMVPLSEPARKWLQKNASHDSKQEPWPQLNSIRQKILDEIGRKSSGHGAMERELAALFLSLDSMGIGEGDLKLLHGKDFEARGDPQLLSRKLTLLQKFKTEASPEKSETIAELIRIANLQYQMTLPLDSELALWALPQERLDLLLRLWQRMREVPHGRMAFQALLIFPDREEISLPGGGKTSTSILEAASAWDGAFLGAFTETLSHDAKKEAITSDLVGLFKAHQGSGPPDLRRVQSDIEKLATSRAELRMALTAQKLGGAAKLSLTEELGMRRKLYQEELATLDHEVRTEAFRRLAPSLKGLTSSEPKALAKHPTISHLLGPLAKGQSKALERMVGAGSVEGHARDKIVECARYLEKEAEAESLIARATKAEAAARSLYVKEEKVFRYELYDRKARHYQHLAKWVGKSTEKNRKKRQEESDELAASYRWERDRNKSDASVAKYLELRDTAKALRAKAASLQLPSVRNPDLQEESLDGLSVAIAEAQKALKQAMLLSQGEQVWIANQIVRKEMEIKRFEEQKKDFIKQRDAIAKVKAASYEEVKKFSAEVVKSLEKRIEELKSETTSLEERKEVAAKRMGNIDGKGPSAKLTGEIKAASDHLDSLRKQYRQKFDQVVAEKEQGIRQTFDALANRCVSHLQKTGAIPSGIDPADLSLALAKGLWNFQSKREDAAAFFEGAEIPGRGKGPDWEQEPHRKLLKSLFDGFTSGNQPFRLSPDDTKALFERLKAKARDNQAMRDADLAQIREGLKDADIPWTGMEVDWGRSKKGSAYLGNLSAIPLPDLRRYLVALGDQGRYLGIAITPWDELKEIIAEGYVQRGGSSPKWELDGQTATELRDFTHVARGAPETMRRFLDAMDSPSDINTFSLRTLSAVRDESTAILREYQQEIKAYTDKSRKLLKHASGWGFKDLDGNLAPGGDRTVYRTVRELRDHLKVVGRHLDRLYAQGDIPVQVPETGKRQSGLTAELIAFQLGIDYDTLRDAGDPLMVAGMIADYDAVLDFAKDFFETESKKGATDILSKVVARIPVLNRAQLALKGLNLYYKGRGLGYRIGMLQKGFDDFVFQNPSQPFGVFYDNSNRLATMFGYAGPLGAAGGAGIRLLGVSRPWVVESLAGIGSMVGASALTDWQMGENWKTLLGNLPMAAFFGIPWHHGPSGWAAKLMDRAIVGRLPAWMPGFLSRGMSVLGPRTAGAGTAFVALQTLNGGANAVHFHLDPDSPQFKEGKIHTLSQAFWKGREQSTAMDLVAALTAGWRSGNMAIVDRVLSEGLTVEQAKVFYGDAAFHAFATAPIHRVLEAIERAQADGASPAEAARLSAWLAELGRRFARHLEVPANDSGSVLQSLRGWVGRSRFRLEQPLASFYTTSARDVRARMVESYREGLMTLTELLEHPLFSRRDSRTGAVTFRSEAWGQIPVEGLDPVDPVHNEFLRQVAAHHNLPAEDFGRFLTYGHLLEPPSGRPFTIGDAVSGFSSPSGRALTLAVSGSANASVRRLLAAALTPDQLRQLFGETLAQQIQNERGGHAPDPNIMAEVRQALSDILTHSTGRHPTEIRLQLLVTLSHLQGPRAPPASAWARILGAIRHADAGYRVGFFRHVGELKNLENLMYDPTPDAQRRLFIEASTPRLGNEPAWLPSEARRLFLHIELSILKFLNDVVFPNDKAIQMAAIGLYQRILMDLIRTDPRYQPLLDMLVRVGEHGVQYSDYKTLRFLFDVPPARRAEVLELLNRLHAEAGGLFEFQLLRLLSPEARQRLTQLGGQAAEPRNWYLAGIGTSAPQAALAARYGRNLLHGPGRVTGIVPVQDTAAIERELAQQFQTVEALRQQVEAALLPFNQIGGEGLLVDANGGQGAPRYVLSYAAIEALRVARDVAGVHLNSAEGFPLVQRIFRERFGITLTPEQARQLGHYFHGVDNLSASPLFAGRQNPSFEGSHGIISGDLVGQGVRNLQLTMAALARRPPRPGDNARQIVEGGIAATVEGINQGMGAADATQARFQAAANGEGHYQASGDDMLFRPSAPLTTASFEAFLRRLLAQPGASPGAYRLVSVPREVPVGQRAGVVVAGEKLEKALRKALIGMIDANGLPITAERCRNLLLAVEVTGMQNGQPVYRLIVGGSQATPAMLSAVRRALGAIHPERGTIDTPGTRLLPSGLTTGAIWRERQLPRWSAAPAIMAKPRLFVIARHMRGNLPHPSRGGA